MKIDPDDALEKVCRTMLTQVGLGLVFVYAMHILEDGLASGENIPYFAYFAILATFMVGILWAIMSLKVFYGLSQWLSDYFLIQFRPSFLTDLATLILDLVVMSVPIVSGYQALHFAQVFWK